MFAVPRTKQRAALRLWLWGAVALAGTALPAQAGPFILAGTDAEEHGSAAGPVNLSGWLFMQRSLENIAASPFLSKTDKKVVTLGTTGGAASTAEASAFNLSVLPGQGWTRVNVDGVTDINNFFNGTGVHNVNNTSIIMLNSGDNTTGGLTATEEAALTANAAAIDSFIGAGGGLFSQGNSYGFLSALAPGLTATDVGTGGFTSDVTLTPAGAAAFPGLTNADLAGADPWHAYFSNLPLSIDVLGTAPQGTPIRNIIIGGDRGGTIANLPPVVDDAVITIDLGDTASHTFTGMDPEAGALLWQFLSFDGPGMAPVFVPGTRMFTWDSTGSMVGTYTATVQATDPGNLFDTGTLTIHVRNVGVAVVPEPATSAMALLGLAALGRRRRRA